MNFWDNVFSGPQAQDRQSPKPPQAWWQDGAHNVLERPSSPRLGDQYVNDTRTQEQEIRALRKRGHQQISPGEADQIAAYDLATKPQYQDKCPECDSGNFLAAGARVSTGGYRSMPTAKCFDFGFSARGPERALGAASGTGSIHTRQIDTGGAGGSMFGKFNGVPRAYMPKT